MKKVVHLITLLELGGAQGNTIYTVHNLNPNEFETHLWCGPGAYWDKQVQTQLGPFGRVKFFPNLVRNVNPVKDVLVVFDLIRSFRKFRPDILHTHSSKAGILGRLAGHLAGVPIIIHTFHGFGFNDQQKPWTKWLYVTLERMAAEWARTLIFVSEANQTEATKLKIGKQNQYRLIRSGVPIDAIRHNGANANPTDIKNDLGIPLHHKLVITISAFKPQKNLFDFLTMAKQVKKQIEDVSFLLVGDGEQRFILEQRIHEFGLMDTVKLVGWRKDATVLLSASDVFVLTSLWEGLPRALVEALILGKPSVCYETDGVKDLLRHGGGAMVKQGDTDAMVAAVVRLLSDSHAWQAASEQSKSLITSEFDIDDMVRSQEKLYLQLNHS